MDFLPYIFIAVAIGIVLFVIRTWIKSLEAKSNVSDELIAWMKDLGSRVETSTRDVDRKLSQNMDMFNKRLDRAAEAMMGVQKSLGEFSEIGRNMQQLQEFLQSPKLRGNLGEQILKELLSQCLPTDCFELQYTFKNGEKVDAIIKTSNGLIPIDSKFPISNFKRMLETKDTAEKEQFKKEFEKDVKIHIKSISQKYILVGEGTIDYAIMYIPSESVYYEIINSGGLYDYAAERRVVPVSPMSFYAYLKVILLSFEGQRIAKEAKEIMSILRTIRKDFEKTDEAMGVLNKHIVNAYNQSTQVTKNLSLLGQKIESTASIAPTTVQEKLIE